jgi:hypothetical protein
VTRYCLCHAWLRSAPRGCHYWAVGPSRHDRYDMIVICVSVAAQSSLVMFGRGRGDTFSVSGARGAGTAGKGVCAVAQVVCVHGVGQQREAANTLHALWAPALCGGVRLAGGRLAEAEVRCAFYGDLFRPPGGHLAPVDRPLRANDLDPFERDLLAEWWEEAARTDALVVAPDAPTLARAPRSVQGALRALSGSRFFATLGKRALLGDLRQVRDYFEEPEVRSRAQQRVSEAVGDDTRALVGHSLGSVVAYEALCANPGWPVRMLVTLGSPFGDAESDLRSAAADAAACGRGAAGTTRSLAGPGPRVGELGRSGRCGGTGQRLARGLRTGSGLLGNGQRRDRSRRAAVFDCSTDRVGHLEGRGWPTSDQAGEGGG